jgi:hypothetical protein
MQERDKQTQASQRQDPRQPLDGQVTVRFEACTLEGSGQNVSAQGVFFTAMAAIPVTVVVAGHGELQGQLVRVESMGGGRLGIAVRFDAPHPALVP